MQPLEVIYKITAIPKALTKDAQLRLFSKIIFSKFFTETWFSALSRVRSNFADNYGLSPKNLDFMKFIELWFSAVTRLLSNSAAFSKISWRNHTQKNSRRFLNLQTLKVPHGVKAITKVLKTAAVYKYKIKPYKFWYILIFGH